ncbi:MAG: hypothetical protein AB7O88_28465 [Reyranellaceae bacterium]
MTPLTADLPDIALSIMQPWAFLVAGGWKPVENRDWKPWNPGLKYRGPFAIHAGRKADAEGVVELHAGRHPVTGRPLPDEIVAAWRRGQPMGGIVGVGEIADAVTALDSDWFVGPYGLVVRNARPVPFVPCLGALGFFRWREREAEPLKLRRPSQGQLL